MQDVEDMIIKILRDSRNLLTFLRIFLRDDEVAFYRSLSTVSALSALSALGLYSIVELLLKDKVDLEQTDTGGFTALHY